MSKELLGEWKTRVFQELAKCGEDGQQALHYMQRKGTQIGFRKQRSSWAMWDWFDKNIYLNSEQYAVNKTKPTDPYMLSLIVHEAWHLRQGMLEALSVYGELSAWQAGFRVLHLLKNGNLLSLQQKMLSIPLRYDRNLLKQAAGWMVEHSPGYEIHKLPLYPLHHEIWWRFTGKSPK